jgi:hypothetical protein
MHAYDEQARHSGVIYVLMLVIALAFGGFLWQLYRSPDIPRIAAPSEPYKTEPRVETPPDMVESGEALTVSEAMDEGATSEPPAADAATELGRPQLAPAPRFVVNGPYVAQLAALQSEAAVEPAWRRFSSRAPDLFASARLDVERADLGPRGIYYRVRAGYFADRAEAARFCERIRQMGQDCIPTAR